MPVAKDKCICQICVCGRHNCADFQRNPLILDSGGKVKNSHQSIDDDDDDDNNATIELPIIIESNQENVSSPPVLALETSLLNRFNDSLDKNLIEKTTTTKRTKLIRHKRSNHTNSDQILVPIIIDETDNEMKSTNDEQQQQQQKAQENDLNERSCSECLIIDNHHGQRNRNQRQTWKTSPEQVEELTRSLSRMRNDEHGNQTTTTTYQKSKTKTATKKTNNNKETKSKPSHSKINIINHKQPQYMMPVRVVSTTRIVNTMTEDDPITTTNVPTNDPTTVTTGFLPPITGFSDTDSSFSSIVCSSDDCDKIHCICETLKKTHLEEHQHQQQQPPLMIENDDYDRQHRQHPLENGINFINMDDADNWIVVRPKRSRPRDNLKLEGPMELETTFRSTYGRQSGSDKSKRSTSQNSQQLYCNTRRGRHSGSTPLLRSATKRKTIRNRPKTSLRTGGHGYWSTNNRDAYKNFIIINGEAKTVVDGNNKIKLPKVVARTTMMTNEEKNRCKYDIMDDTTTKTTKPLRMVDGEEIRKFEKKSYIQTSDGQGEMMAEKLVRKVRCGGGGGSDRHSKSKKIDDNDNHDDNNVDDERINDQIEREGDPIKQEQQQQQQSTTTMKYRPYDAYQVDHIKDLGLLEMKSQLDGDDNLDDNNNDINRRIDGQNYRSHVRRLHETSDDFHILTGGHPTLNKPSKTKSQPSRNDHNKSSMIINGHAVMASTRKPFILPQRIQRHKNESSIQMFDGDMEFLTTTKSTYRNGRQGSAQRRQHQQQQQQQQQPLERKRTAGRRSQRSGRRRNLFRQSSDSIFARPDTAENKQNKQNEQQQQQRRNSKINENTIYKTEFGDRSLYCPALDVVNPSGPNNPYKMTAETGGHKYYKM
ncbi:hypothetical protein DERF_013178 [Dermatophagoides farinae]|uniref:Uncharacterized protein n=1 Tax=Dermatophagoides farinae TaxID=6954 RepID=A0A922KVZ8_DERFA|nr:hypothetical protein DERF_013178 [Dermatophagoides farinae]